MKLDEKIKDLQLRIKESEARGESLASAGQERKLLSDISKTLAEINKRDVTNEATINKLSSAVDIIKGSTISKQVNTTNEFLNEIDNKLQ